MASSCMSGVSICWMGHLFSISNPTCPASRPRDYAVGGWPKLRHDRRDDVCSSSPPGKRQRAPVAPAELCSFLQAKGGLFRRGETATELSIVVGRSLFAEAVLRTQE